MDKELFSFSNYLDEHPIWELVYKAFLALSLSILFFYLASIGDDAGGAYVKKAIESGDKGMYWNVLGSFGILFFLGGMWFKIIDFKIPDGAFKNIWSYPSATIQKIAQDILVSAFSLSAAFLGYIAFTYIDNFNTPNDFWLLTLITSWGIIAIGFLTLVLSLLVYILKVKGDHVIIGWLQRRNIFLVLLMYPLLAFIFWRFFWHYQT